MKQKLIHILRIKRCQWHYPSIYKTDFNLRARKSSEFYIMQENREALDSIRAQEAKRLKQKGNEVMETALYHQLGNLPEPNLKHEFW